MLSDYKVKEIRKMVQAEELRRVLKAYHRELTAEEFRRMLMKPIHLDTLGNCAEEFCRMLMKPIHLDTLGNCAPPIQLDKLDTWLKGLRRKILCPDDPHLSEEVNVYRQMVMDLNKNSVAYEEMSQYISEVIEKIRRNQLMEKLKLFIFLLAFLLHCGNVDYKHLARPERGKISCINVYLLGNDGAHSYNGNGNCGGTQSNDEESRYLIPRVHANLPPDVLQRRPTDREITRMSRKIGPKYYLLAFELGLKHVQVEHLMSDYPDTLLQIQRMFFIWRDQMEGNATFEILVNAMAYVDINPDIVCQCYERA